MERDRKFSAFNDIMSTRRSIRKFREDSIPDDDIRMLVDAASAAPSGANMQPWRFIAVRNKGVKDKLVEIIRDDAEKVDLDNFILKDPGLYTGVAYIKKYSTFINKAPLIICVQVKIIEDGMFNVIRNYTKTDRYDASVLSGFVEVQSAAAAIENLLLTAHAMGYGSCWVRVPFCSKENLEGMLNIQRPWHLLAFVPVGVADETPKRPARKKIDDIMTIID